MMFGWHGWWGVFAMGAFWVLVITLVILAARGWSRPSSEAPQGPGDILAERFARGEISEQEFRDRSRALEGTKT
jgi:putative membrane protein